jgi:quercetin dioxygenase-like cupin family protein
MEHPTLPVTHIADVRAGAAVEPGRLGHSTVLASPGVRVIVLTFEAGFTLKKHSAPKILLMQALDGCLRVAADGQVTDLVPGALLRLDTNLEHEVEALEESRLMLTLIG